MKSKLKEGADRELPGFSKGRGDRGSSLWGVAEREGTMSYTCTWSLCGYSWLLRTGGKRMGVGVGRSPRQAAGPQAEPLELILACFLAGWAQETSWAAPFPGGLVTAGRDAGRGF